MKLCIRETSQQNESPSDRDLAVSLLLSAMHADYPHHLGVFSLQMTVCVNKDGSDKGLVESDSLKESYETKLLQKSHQKNELALHLGELRAGIFSLQIRFPSDCEDMECLQQAFPKHSWGKRNLSSDTD